MGYNKSLCGFVSRVNSLEHRSARAFRSVGRQIVCLSAGEVNCDTNKMSNGYGGNCSY